MPYTHYTSQCPLAQRRKAAGVRAGVDAGFVCNDEKVWYSVGMKDFGHAAFSLVSPITEEEAAAMHPMSLAFVGDAVQSLFMRTAVAVADGGKTGAQHREVTRTVNAVAQAAASARISPLFTEREADVFRRARNCHIQTSAKHAERAEYRRASGLEAVLGFLFLTGNTERLTEFLALAAKEEEGC